MPVVMVAGGRVVHNGRITTVDETALLMEASALALDNRAEIRAMTAAAAKLEPYFHGMAFRTHARDGRLTRTSEADAH